MSSLEASEAQKQDVAMVPVETPSDSDSKSNSSLDPLIDSGSKLNKVDLKSKKAPKEPADLPKTFTIITSEGSTHHMPESLLNMSNTLKECASALGDHSTDPIPIPNVTGDTFKLILKWCVQHEHDKPCQSRIERQLKERTDWDARFFGKLENDELFEVIIASDYLDINGCLDAGCKQASLLIKGKMPEQIREVFAIPTDSEDEAEAEAAEAEKEAAKSKEEEKKK